MNFQITINGINANDAQQFQAGLNAFLKSFNIEAEGFMVTNNHTVVLGNPVMAAAPVETSAEVPSEEIPPAIAAVTPPITETEPCGICGETNCDCDKTECGCNKTNETVEEPQEQFAFENCRVLSLSTLAEIKSFVDLKKVNTVLQVEKVSLEEGMVRFKFNSFDYVLPTQINDGRTHFVNESHSISPATVRLVLDFQAKNYPCLVDVIEGETDVLTIGGDLYEILQKEKSSDVSSK